MPYKDREKHKQKNREYYWTNPEIRERVKLRNKLNYNPVLNHDRHLKRMYGLPIGGYDILFKSQNGLCRICKEPHKPGPRFKYMHVDHDHITNKIRGLLCFACNHRLGWYEKYTKDILSYLGD